MNAQTQSIGKGGEFHRPRSPKNPLPFAISTSIPKGVLKMAALFAMPVVLASFFFLEHPFKDEIDCKVFSVASLSPVQQCNISIAANKLDNYIIKPGESFSFNRVVGPRTDSRGYRSAPSYLGNGSPATFGGGICLLSSALYQAALETGLKIEERSPHMRTISSVTPGLDATVWYGNADLKFRNISSHPVQIKSMVKDHNLYVKLFAENASDMPAKAELKTAVTRQTRTELLVESFGITNDGRRNFISRDHYDLH